MDSSPASAPPQLPSDAPFTEKWELLKPYLERLYLDEKRKLPEVVQIIKTQYGFDANEAQYKYQFGRKWGWKKNMSATKKAMVCERGQTRAALGKSTVVKYKGREVDPKKIRRHAKEAARKEISLNAAADRAGGGQGSLFGPALPFGNRIFLNWNMPYGALDPSQPRGADRPSPFGPSVTTPSDVSMGTPPGGVVSSPQNAPSPLSSALKKKTTIDRAHLFVQGRHDDLIRSMDKAERRMMSTWLYQFWLFSFTTAKYWGRGPRDWTADILSFNKHQEPISVPSPNTPGMIANSPGVEIGHRNTVGSTQKPSPLCCWSIHTDQVYYDDNPSPPFEDGSSGPQEESWADWPESWKEPSFEERLRNGLESNDFSNLKADQLPLSIPQVAKAAERSPNELLEESLGFAIMGRNHDLIRELTNKVIKSDTDLSGLYPYHLATSYLDGSKSCCSILEILCEAFEGKLWLREHYINGLGHTVLDNLMIAILKGHTSTLPGGVDDALKRENRFSGEEVDVCGRWDADSDCFRALLASGRSSIPFEWKHKFCHTSVQAICHCIQTLVNYGADLNAPSGLFLKHCSCCGQRLQLFPLHTLVLTAFQLAQSGCKDEDLFGVVTCFLCLLTEGANTQLKAQVSPATLLGAEQNDYCDHEELNPFELAKKVPAAITSKWSSKAITGWQVFCEVLHMAQNDQALPRRNGGSGVDYCLEGSDNFRGNCFDHLDFGISCSINENAFLGHIWSSAQTEVLTYRRLKVEDPWISENFDMDELLKSLDAGTRVSIGLVDEQMMNPYCHCGRFEDGPFFVLRQHAAAYYFSNLDDWNRTTFIELPLRCDTASYRRRIAYEKLDEFPQRI